jgi:putative membrane protein (TIGR04086 family)
MRKSGKREKGVAYRIAAGIAVSLIFILILLFVMSGLTAKDVLGENTMKSAVIAACFIGSLAGGLIAARSYKGRRLPVSAGIAGLLILLMFLTGSVVAGERGFSGQFAANAASAAAGALLAGAAGRKKRFRR